MTSPSPTIPPEPGFEIALPRHVYDRIQAQQELRRIESQASVSAGHGPECELVPKCNCHAGDIDSSVHHSTCPLSTKKGGEPCASITICQTQAQPMPPPADAIPAPQQATTASASVVDASNAAPEPFDPTQDSGQIPSEHLADYVLKLHIITGPNGMCMCGKDGITCGERLRQVSHEIADCQLIANFPAAMQKEGK